MTIILSRSRKVTLLKASHRYCYALRIYMLMVSPNFHSTSQQAAVIMGSAWFHLLSRNTLETLVKFSTHAIKAVFQRKNV